MYVVIGLSYYYLFVPDFIDHYAQYVIRQAPAGQLAEKTQEMEEYKEMYKSPLFAILITYSEVLPIGLEVALVSALMVRRKTKPIKDKSKISY